MAYVLSEELQRRKLLNQGHNIFRVNLFGSMDGHFLRSTSEWDVSLQETVAALHELGDTVPPLDLDATHIEEIGDGTRQSFQTHSSYRVDTKDSYSDQWIGKAEDKKKGIGAASAPQSMSAVNKDRAFRNIISSPASVSSNTVGGQEKNRALFDSDSLIDELNLVLKHITEDRKKGQEVGLSRSTITPGKPPLAHSTPVKSTSHDALSDSDWTAILYNEFRARILDVSVNEIIKCEFDCSRIDKHLMEFVRRIFVDPPESSSSHTKMKEITNRGICYALVEMRMVGLDIEKHLTMWHRAWQARMAFVKAFNESLGAMPHSELRHKLLKVSFQFNDSHRVLLNCVLMLYHWHSTRYFSLEDQDLNLKDILHKKTEKDFARLKSMSASQTSEYDSEPSETNCNFSDKLNSSNENLTQHVSEAPKKDAFFDEFEWQAILFKELKVRVCNELSFLVAGKKTLYDEEDGFQVRRSTDFVDVIREVFPDVVLSPEKLCYFAKIFSGLSKFTQFNFSRHLLQWHSVYKSQSDALKRYGCENVSYAWLIGELNFLNYLPNHPLRIIIDCLLMLSIDNVDDINRS